jgi:23S rRNA pseudouridine2605 synthase
MTNDGELANKIMHPSNKIEKQYIAKVVGIIKGEDIRELKKGITIDGSKCIPNRVKLRKFDRRTNSSIVEIVISEGKNHEVKKMFENLGFEVEKLKRERIAFLSLGKLNSGEYRKLNPKEIKQLLNL